MLILTIVPIHLNYDSNGVMVDPNSQIDMLEHKVMALESLFSAKILNQYLPYRVTLVDNNDMNAITTALQDERNNTLQYLQTQGSTDFSDTEARLLSINTMLEWVNVRITDLQALRTALLNNEQLNYVVSGVDNANVVSVETELANALAYQQMLTNSKQFWEQVFTLQGGKLEDLNDGDDSGNPPLNPDKLSNEASSKQRIAYLMSLYNSMGGVRDINELIAMENEIKDGIKNEMSKISSIVVGGNSKGDGSSRAKINELSSELSSLHAEKSASLRYASLKNSIMKEISTVGVGA